MKKRVKFFVVHSHENTHYCNDGDDVSESKYQFLKDSVTEWLEIDDKDLYAVQQKVAELLKINQHYGPKRLLAVEEVPMTGGEIKVTLDLIKEAMKKDEEKKRLAEAKRKAGAAKKKEIQARNAKAEKLKLYEQLKAELEKD